jgi:membrane associated rhomboid family serine protease
MFPIKDSVRIPYIPVITYLIIVINSAVFLYQYSLSPEGSYDFSLTHALVPRRYFDPAWASAVGLDRHDYWPFISGTFLHGGWWHLILNMWTLYIFGSSLEGRLGRVPFLSFYLVCGLIASFTHAYFNQDSDVPTVGASGAIAGILGAYATTFPRARVTILILIIIIPFFFQVPALAYALIWFILQFMQGFMQLISPAMGGGIAWWAHIGGFIGGIILIPLWRFGPDLTYDENAPWLPKPSLAPCVTRDGQIKKGPPPWRRGPWG